MKAKTDKKRNVLPVVLLAVALLSSCYDDKGNYDYREIEEIGLSFPGNIGTEDDVKYIRRLGETLSIHPEVTFQHPENLTYKWERYTDRTDTEILKNTRDLDVTLEYGDEAALTWKAGGYSLRYTVQDTVTGQAVQKLVRLTVRSITPVGVYILHGNENEADLGTIEDDNFIDGLTDGIVTPDYYSSQNNGEKLQGKGAGCVWFYGDANPGILVFTDSDGKYINTTSFQNELDYDDLFQGDVPTTPVRRLTLDSNGTAYVYSDDNVYDIDVMYGMDEGACFSPIFATKSEYEEWQPVPGYFFSDAGFLDGGVNLGPLAYSISRSAFILYDWYNAPKPGYVWPLSSCGDDPNSPVFNPKDMSGMQLIGMDYGKSNSYGMSQNQWALFRRETDHAVMAYRFNEEAYYDDLPTYDIATVLASDRIHPELLDVNCFQMSPLTEGIGFFSTPSGVYSLDMVNGMGDAANELFTVEGGERITKIKMLKFNDNLAVENANAVFGEKQGLCLYISTWNGAQGYVYALFVDAEGGLDTSHGEVKKYEGFKEIKDMCFRLQ